MAESIDQLQIDIQAQAVKANDAIDKLIGKLDKLSTSLEKIDYSKITGLANGVNRLSSSMQGMNNVRTADFTRLANNIQKIGNINVSALNSAASSMSHMTRAFSGLGTVLVNAQAVGDMAKNISKLGNKSIQSAIINIPRLAIAMDDLMRTLSKSPQVSNNIIQTTNALANLASQSSKINTATNVITNGLNRTNSAIVQTTKNTFSLSSAIGKFYQSSFMIGRVANGLYSSIIDTSDYIEGFNYYTVAFEKIASEWDDNFENYGSENAQKYVNAFVEQMNEEFGKMSGLKLNLSADMDSGALSSSGLKNLSLNLQEVTQYGAQLASITNSVGQNGTVSLTASNVFTKLAGDMSSLFNKDYSVLANNLQSGLIGQSRALYKYGIDITNATLQTYAYELGIEKAVSEMTQAEKMQLRMIAILDQSRVAWGDLADTINTPANQLRQWTNNCKEASMVLGQLFLPIVEHVLPVLNGATIAMTRLLSNIAGFMGIKINLDSIGTGTSDITDELEDVTTGFDNATSSAKSFKNQLQGFDKLNLITTQESSGNSSNVSSGGGVDLTDEIAKAAEEYEKAWNEAYTNMENKAEKFAEKFESSFKLVENVVKDFAIGDYFQAGQDVSKLVVGINEFLSNAISSVDWEQVGDNIGDFLAGIDWSEVIRSSFKLKFDIAKAIADVWFESFNTAPIETGIITALAGAKFLGLDTALVKALNTSLMNATGLSIGKFAWPLTALVGLDLALVSLSKREDQSMGEALYEREERINATTYVDSQSFIDTFNFLGEKLNETFGSPFEIEERINATNYIDAESFIDSLGYIRTEVGAFFSDWGEKIITWKTDVNDANAMVTQAYADMFSDFADDISAWWTDDVSPYFTRERWEEIGDNFKTGLSTKWKEFDSWWKSTGVYSWWNNSVAPWFTAEKWQSLSNGIKIGLSNKWNEVKNWWNRKGDLSKINTDVTDFLQKIKEKWKKVTDWWDNSKPSLSELTLKMKIPKVSITYDEDAWNASLFQALGFDGAPRFSVSYYATGGFPEDGWFRASKGEYFGKFDDGTSYIANNNQITNGVASGVASAVRDANAEQNALLREQNALLRQILAKETGISSRDIFDAVRNEDQGYAARNGQSAFAY